MLTIYNSLTRQKEPFVPIEPNQVRLYVCGMTVYDYCHVGHARVMVVFDVVVRYLRALGYAVTYVRNITDIDDKIIQRAHESNETVAQLTTRFIQAMHKDLALLGVLPPDYEPCATQSIPAIITMIETLIAKGFAYLAENGDVYYAVERFKNYGQLSGKQLEDLLAGARVGVEEAKRNPLDFVLWKAAKPEEPSWQSPWGLGRPGWHIECSAMSTAQLGNHFDIHGGGMDLQFPHHENEIAQSEGATGEPFVNVWMHNGFVRINEEKMSKSLGNFFTIRNVLQRYRPEVIRYFILTSHYRSPLNYSDQQLDAASQALEGLYLTLRGLQISNTESTEANAYWQRFMQAMNDDFNTPEALAVLFELKNAINQARQQDEKKARNLAQMLWKLGGILGLLTVSPEQYLQVTHQSLAVAEIEKFIAERNTARAEKNWAEADRIRDMLQVQGIILEDSAKGTSWRQG